MDEVYWDPYDIAVDTDPYGIWRRMRDEAPVYRNDRFGFYALSRFADVEAASREPVLFSSAHATVLELMTEDPWDTSMMIFMDPPAHEVMRRLVSRAFTPRRVTELEDRVRELCRDFLDRQRDRDEFDYVADFGARLPAMVIASLLGVPLEIQDHVRELIDRTFHLEGVGFDSDVSRRAGAELRTILGELVADRRRHERDDLLGGLVAAELDVDGTTRRFSDGEACEFAGLIISAGTETVARLLGWAAVVLGDHPDQRAELADDPTLVAGAVEELLRFEAPSPVQGRWTTADVTMHGTVIPAGSRVALLTASAGRDERRYADADRFDIHRGESHVSFGHGIHFCLGAALARLEGRVALEETLTRYPVWEVDHDRARRLHTSTVRGYSAVPVSVGRR